MVVKNLLMIPSSSVAGIFMLIVTCSLVIPGLSEMNSLITSTIAQNKQHQLLNDNGTADSSNVIQNQIDLKIHTTVSSILDKYFIDLKNHLTVSCVLELKNYKNDLKTHSIHQPNHQNNITENDLIAELSLEIIKLNTSLNQQQEKILKIMEDLAKEKESYKILFDTKTLLDNKLSASLLKNKDLNIQLSQLNDTCKQISCQDKKRMPTVDECSELNKKYTKSLETLITCDNHVLSLYDHQVNLEKNLTILELKIKDIFHENNDTKVEMQHIVDSLQLEISLKAQQYTNISLQLENKIDENKKIIQESIALKKEQAEKLKAIQNEYQSNLTNKQQEAKMLEEIIFEISQKDLVESAGLLKTLISIMKFNEDDVPDYLLKKRQELFENRYNENQAVVVDDLRKRFDDIALTSNSQFSNKYFCNKKISYYNSTICAMLSENLNSYEINRSHKNLAVLSKDTFTGFKNLGKLDLSYNRLYYLESDTFNNLSNLQILTLDYNNLTSLSRHTFNGLEKLEMLYLSHNQINSLQPGTFNNLFYLKLLYIQFNHLTSLPKDIFTGLENLKYLSLAFNRLNYLESTTFYGLSKLIELRLHDNHLTSLSKDIFNGLENLHFLGLASNQLNYLDSNIFKNLPKLNYLSLSDNNLTTYSKNILKNRYNFEIFWL